MIREFEKNNSGRDLFHFDSDEDVFCVYSQYIDDLMMLAKLIRAACADEKTMGMYLNMSEAEKHERVDHSNRNHSKMQENGH
nr:Imm51 family immunity protein [Oscillibacter sp.]